MRLKKLAIGFVIALSVAFALNAVSKNASDNKNSEYANENEALLSTYSIEK